MKHLLPFFFLALSLSAADTPVVVNNTVKNAVPVLVQAPHEPFTFTKQITNPPGSGLIEYTLFSVPAGKRLVIETISVYSRAVGLFDLRLRYNSIGFVNSFALPMTMWPVQNPLASEGATMSGLHNVRMYVASGQTVRVQMIGGLPLPAPNQASPTFLDVSISGHLTDEI